VKNPFQKALKDLPTQTYTVNLSQGLPKYLSTLHDLSPTVGQNLEANWITSVTDTFSEGYENL